MRTILAESLLCSLVVLFIVKTLPSRWPVGQVISISAPLSCGPIFRRRPDRALGAFGHLTPRASRTCSRASLRTVAAAEAAAISSEVADFPARLIALALAHSIAGVALRLADDVLKPGEQLSGRSLPLFPFPIFHKLFQDRGDRVILQDIPGCGFRGLLKRFGERSCRPKRRLAGDHKLGECRQAREPLPIKTVVTPMSLAQRLQERAKNDRGGIVKLHPEVSVGETFNTRRKRRQIRFQRPAGQVPPRDNVVDRDKNEWHLGGDGETHHRP